MHQKQTFLRSVIVDEIFYKNEIKLFDALLRVLSQGFTVPFGYFAPLFHTQLQPFKIAELKIAEFNGKHQKC